MAEEELSTRSSSGSDSEMWETSVDEGRTKSKNKVLPDGFLDPLPPQKSSKLPRLSGYCPPPTQPPSYPPPRPSYYTPPQPDTHAGPSSTPTALQTDTETDSRIFIEPEGDTFYPSKQAIHQIRDIIKSMFDGPYSSWKKIPHNVRDMWFREFQRHFTWLPKHHDRIRRNFNRRVATRLRDMFTDVRKAGQRPAWIGDAIWTELCAEWRSSEYIQMREKNKQNRASDCGGAGTSLHTGGSIPHTEHRRRLKETLGREPTMAELHQRTHQRQKNRQWVDQKSEHIHTEYLRMREQQTQGSQKAGSSTQLSEFDTWQQVAGGKKKGRVYGLGSVAHAAFSSQSSYSMDSSGSTLEVLIKKHVESIHKQYQEDMRAMQNQINRQDTRYRRLQRSLGKDKEVITDEDEDEDEEEEQTHSHDESTE